MPYPEGLRFSLAFILTLASALPANAQGPASGEVRTGPAADYPINLGEPFVVDGETFTPFDTMNYDEVGYAEQDGPGAIGVTGSHKTLPLPSYVEVTALNSGRTILLRLERRGPMRADRLLALSPAAMAQLDLQEGAPIRMRRVNPPEDDRALLRTGEAAPLRMTTPDGLLSSLRKRLPGMGASPPPNARQATSGGVVPVAGAIEPIDPETEASAERDLVNEPTGDVPLAGRVDGSIVENSLSVTMPERPTGFVVQIGAFSLVDNANRLADRVGGFVMRSGPFHLVRIGPFASREKAREALAKLRGQGYSDALIQNID